MSGAGMWNAATSPTALLEALSEAVGVRHELGKAEDARLAQPERIVWVSVPRTRRQRECTSNHYYAEALTVYLEVSNLYEVHLRSIDVAACEEQERLFFQKLIEIGAWATALEVEGTGSVESNDNVAAEQGALIVWPIRLWTPLVYENLIEGHITTTDIGVTAQNSAGTITGTVP